MPEKLLLNNFNEADQARIQAADAFAAAAHKRQVRKSGQPYITHPRAVAAYLSQMGMDADTVIAGLLHDTVEDTKVTPAEIEEKFGKPVRILVEGVTKLGQVEYIHTQEVSEQRHAVSIENIRKLLLAMSKDLRVLMIKLADRRHNLMTLKHLKAADRERIANESLDVFAPLADRLGMGVLKAEMEDMAFKYANPSAYRLVKRLVDANTLQAEAYVDELKDDISELLHQNHINPISIHGRRKHLYSVYRKLTKTEGDITKIYDLTALRIIVPEVKDCYQVLGLLHQQYKPLIYRIKDYIAVPKPNGYRSLHTTVFAKHGKIIEIQIRTPEMHQEAEQGLAAHSIYELHKQSKGYKRGEGATVNKKLSWIQELAGLSALSESGVELMDNLKVDLFRDRIFVFSPKGDLYDLPEGATPVDFAFAIHTDVGLRTQGAKVNGRIAPLDRPLENRDVVEIITRKQAAPNRQWLSFVKTAGARSRIKGWFRSASRDANIVTGKQLIEAQLGTWGIKRFEDIGDERIRLALDTLHLKDTNMLFAAVGEGTVSLPSALRRLLPSRINEAPKPVVKKATTGRMQVLGAPELPCTAASCCQPQPPESIVGYITRGSGVTVHRQNCSNIPNEPDRLLDCVWESAAESTALISQIKVHGYNRIGLVHDITGLILKRQLNIVKITTQSDSEESQRAYITIEVEVPDLFSLNSLVQQLNVQEGVIGVQVTTPQAVELNSSE